MVNDKPKKTAREKGKDFILWAGLVMLMVGAVSASLSSGDVDTLCEHDDNMLVRYAGKWICKEVYWNNNTHVKVIGGLPAEYSNFTFKDMELWYELEDFTDSSGNGIQASCNLIGEKALEFSGTDEYVAIVDNSNFTFGNGTGDRPFSVSGWVKTSVIGKVVIMGKGSDVTGDHEWTLYTDGNGKMSFVMWDQANGISQYVRIGRLYSTPITNDTWYHVVGTYDGSSDVSGIKVYLDGVRVDDTNTVSGNYTGMNANGSNITMGGTFQHKYLTGILEEVAIYDTNLSQTQIDNLYNSGIGYIHDGTEDNIIDGWHFDETAGLIAPSIKTTNDGTLTNMEESDWGSDSNCPASVGGEIGNAMKFDGTSDYLTDSTGLDFSGGGSFAFWVNANTTSGNTQLIASRDTGNHRIGLDLNNGELRTHYYDGSYYQKSTTGTINPNTWYHVIVAYEPGAMNLYLDGVAQGGGNKGSNPASVSFTIGAYHFVTFSKHFNGTIDDFMVFNTTLNQTHATQLYDKTFHSNRSSVLTTGATSGTTENSSIGILTQLNVTVNNTFTTNRAGIGTTTPTYPLQVMGTSGLTNDSISIYAEGNISASGYITRTSIWEDSYGDVWDYIRPKEQLRTGLSQDIRHDLMSPNVIMSKITYLSGYDTQDVIIDGVFHGTIDIPVYTTKEVEGVLLDDLLAKHEQAIWELKQEIETLKGGAK